MATRKPDSEVGPLGVWAYDTARLLGLSSAQVAQRAGVTEPTIRKIEGGSNRNPSKRVVFEMARYFREVAEAQGMAVPPPPGRYGAGSDTGDTPPFDPAAYLERIDSLVALVNRLVDELAATRLNSPLTPEEQARLYIAGVEGEPQPPTPSSPRPLGRLPSGGTPRKGSRATASTEVPQ